MCPQRASLKLTASEREALALVCEGMGDAQVGGAMGVSENTAGGYVRMAMIKLGAETRIEAVQFAAGVELAPLIRAKEK